MASKKFEELARHVIKNNILKHRVREFLLNAGICEVCQGDVAITTPLGIYQEIERTFSGTREYKLLANLAASVVEGDAVKFIDSIQEYDSMMGLDPWKKELLVSVATTLKAKVEEDG